MARDASGTTTVQSFEDASRLAQTALDLAERHRTPPVPKVFEVWFNYSGGLHETIRARIDRAMDEGPKVPADLLHKLHDEFLSPQAIGEGVERIGDRMDSDLAEVINLIEDGMGASDAYAAVLRRTDDALARDPKPGEARRHIHGLRDANKHHADRIARFSDNVMALRAQFTAMQQELRELRQSVLLDHLTNLPNRRHFDQTLDAALRRARRETSRMTVILCDIDHFKAFNDRWGRAMADQVLTHAASALRQCLRPGDMAARVGGDEFAVILPGSPIDTGRLLADSMRRTVSQLRLVRSGSGERVANLTASFGVASALPGEGAAKLMARLEDSVLRAKEMGRNQICGGE